jgi:hypothetical protein
MLGSITSEVRDVLVVLKEYDYVVTATDSVVKGPNLKLICELVNALRRKRNHGGSLYESNLSMWMKNPEAAPPEFLNELTVGIGMTELGFDESIWDQDNADILRDVRAALTGGVMATVLRGKLTPSLFELIPPICQGFAFEEVDQPIFRYKTLPPIPEFVVGSGALLAAKANLPFDGYLRVYACQDGVFIALNHFLEIPTHQLDAGAHAFRENAPTNSQSARTLVYAFASPNEALSHWPVSHLKKNRLPQVKFQKLVNDFYAAIAYTKASNVQSFLTAQV